ncbi:putative mitochondrial hydrolase-like protein [Leptomonas pyrrhocoris]|uniref:Putative mitochondrial hydrolase-like protein n=1 Tax=Leptomonas pyrrhocoris TaxID=157538 RepID=A0A0N0DSM9_LEPPY|nr:putative mitochondrial hydrolase-like protein [Leptomonas pyrrhocoris]KPA76241.1 putative mitochondrial hydrolase-like protein [Leptomonas pyrrhocoris]|eukprot:XP_015654680.1 putative mitochondrial hydrolase-like protein [Leptomonas pyrrhocoris]
MTSMMAPEQPFEKKKAVLPPEVLAELDSIFTMAPKDEFAEIGRCRTTQKDITICYNTFGDPRNPCMLLIMGLSSPGTYWDTRFCRYIADKGFYVVRYDNRDLGLSTHFDGYPAPNILRLALPAWASLGEVPLAYTLDDMADDAVGLLRTLNIKKAHIVGCSMGGMIAQLVALHHPEVVASLCLHSTSTGAPWPKPGMLINMLDGPESPDDVQCVLDYRVRLYKAMAGDMKFYEHEFRIGMWWDVVRSNYHDGAGRHLAAIVRSPDRSELLRTQLNRVEGPQRVTGTPSSLLPPTASHIPVVVLHGGRDPTIPVRHARHLAECINGSKLVIFPHMGHYFSKDMFRLLADEMVLNARGVAVTD